MPTDLLTTLAILSLAAMNLAAMGIALRRRQLIARADDAEADQAQPLPHAATWVRGLVAATAIGAATTFAYRWAVVYQQLPPIEAHVDGLLVIGALFACITLFLGQHNRAPGIYAFALPSLVLIFAWAFCASWFTYEPFHFSSAWKTLHLIGVYLGSLGVFIAAMAGVMYLAAQRRLRNKVAPDKAGPMPSLERIEQLIIRTAALGFAMLSVGIVTGVIIVASDEPTALGPGWWHSPKVVLGVLTWVVYFLLMNVRHATVFRGKRAAWLSIAGLVLLIATFGVVPGSSAQATPEAATETQVGSGIAPAPLPSEGRGWVRGETSAHRLCAAKTNGCEVTLFFGQRSELSGFHPSPDLSSQKGRGTGWATRMGGQPCA